MRGVCVCVLVSDAIRHSLLFSYFLFRHHRHRQQQRFLSNSLLVFGFFIFTSLECFLSSCFLSFFFSSSLSCVVFFFFSFSPSSFFFCLGDHPRRSHHMRVLSRCRWGPTAARGGTWAPARAPAAAGARAAPAPPLPPPRAPRTAQAATPCRRAATGNRCGVCLFCVGQYVRPSLS